MFGQTSFCVARWVSAFLILFLLIANASAEERPSSSGTGFFVNRSGWVVTNAHVVDGCKSVVIKGFGTANEIRTDRRNDLAAINVPSRIASPSIPLSALQPRLGEEVIALGYPLAGILSDSVKMTTGNISSLAGIGNDTRELQVSVPIQPGNSGGPLVDMSGRLVGVMTGSLKKELSDEIGYNTQNVNFAIKVSAIVSFLRTHDIAFTSQNGEPGNKSTADIAEDIASSTVQVLCYGRPKKSNGPTVTQKSQQPVRSRLEDARGYDAIGFDYALQKNVSYGDCKAICNQERKCQALTYNQRYRVCFLKSDVVVMVRNDDAIAAYHDWKASDIFLSDITVRANMDAPGGDYRRIRQSDFVLCIVECIKDTRCRGFSYVRRKKDCWLKERINRVRKKNGVELGFR